MSFHTDKVALIVGLCVGLGVLLVVIIIIIAVVIACRRCCNKQVTMDRSATFAAGYNDRGEPHYELEEDDRNRCCSPTATNASQNMNEQACARVDEPDENKMYMSLAEPDPAYNSEPYYSSLHTV